MAGVERYPPCDDELSGPGQQAVAAGRVPPAQLGAREAEDGEDELGQHTDEQHDPHRAERLAPAGSTPPATSRANDSTTEPRGPAPLLLAQARPDGRALLAVYVASLAVLFGVSALYHRRSWRPRLRAVIRRLDHATIFVLIAGSYTAVVGLALPWEQGGTTLTVVCAGAIVGIVAGGLLYTLGAVVYATRRPRLVPHVFGYHEVFHALVIAASICHTLLITSLAG